VEASLEARRAEREAKERARQAQTTKVPVAVPSGGAAGGAATAQRKANLSFEPIEMEWDTSTLGKGGKDAKPRRKKAAAPAPAVVRTDRVRLSDALARITVADVTAALGRAEAATSPEVAVRLALAPIVEAGDPATCSTDGASVLGAAAGDAMLKNLPADVERTLGTWLEGRDVVTAGPAFATLLKAAAAAAARPLDGPGHAAALGLVCRRAPRMAAAGWAHALRAGAAVVGEDRWMALARGWAVGRVFRVAGIRRQPARPTCFLPPAYDNSTGLRRAAHGRPRGARPPFPRRLLAALRTGRPGVGCPWTC